jgi:hypothetical protein
VAVFVDEAAEHIGAFDTPNRFNVGARGLGGGHGYVQVDVAGALLAEFGSVSNPELARIMAVAIAAASGAG